MRVRFVLCALLLAGCDRVVGFRWVDPDIEVGDDGPDPISGDPQLALGFYVEQLLEPLAEGDGLPVVYGLQGGTWTMPAVRTTGIANIATVSCDVVTEGGEQVGVVETRQIFVRATDGWFEVQAFPIPIVHEAPNQAASIEDLYGVKATLSCTVSDDQDHEASQTRGVILVEG
ncbi:MAG: hypothetical protein IPM79_21240 [Polyangiaceae bacterium]|nr:hypothetical protein [Polyangiaceae bacterium]MBK8940073.1 hypothetical protein [Polyangiaceae bacterium]